MTITQQPGELRSFWGDPWVSKTARGSLQESESELLSARWRRRGEDYPAAQISHFCAREIPQRGSGTTERTGRIFITGVLIKAHHPNFFLFLLLPLRRSSVFWPHRASLILCPFSSLNWRSHRPTTAIEQLFRMAMCTSSIWLRSSLLFHDNRRRGQ